MRKTGYIYINTYTYPPTSRGLAGRARIKFDEKNMKVSKILALSTCAGKYKNAFMEEKIETLTNPHKTMTERESLGGRRGGEEFDDVGMPWQNKKLAATWKCSRNPNSEPAKKVLTAFKVCDQLAHSLVFCCGHWESHLQRVERQTKRFSQPHSEISRISDWSFETFVERRVQAVTCDAANETLLEAQIIEEL